MSQREFYVVITKGEDGYFIGDAPQLRSCMNQGKTVDDLMRNMRETIEFCLEDDDLNAGYGFVGFHKIAVSSPAAGRDNAANGREFYIVIEQDEDGSLVGEAAGLKGAHSFGSDFDELMVNMREVIELCLEDEDAAALEMEFAGIQRIEV